MRCRCDQKQYEALKLKGYASIKNGRSNELRSVVNELFRLRTKDGTVVDAEDDKQRYPQSAESVEGGAPAVLLELGTAVLFLYILIFTVCLLLGGGETLIERLVLVDLAEVHDPLFQSALVAVRLFEGFVGVLVEEHGHPLAEGSTAHGTQQDGTACLLLEVGTVGEFGAVLQHIDGDGTQDATEAVGCRVEVVGSQALLVLVALQVEAGFGLCQLFVPAMQLGEIGKAAARRS